MTDTEGLRAAVDAVIDDICDEFEIVIGQPIHSDVRRGWEKRLLAALRDTGPRPDSGDGRPPIDPLVAAHDKGWQEGVIWERADAKRRDTSGIDAAARSFVAVMEEERFWGRVAFYLGPNARTAVDHRPYDRVKVAYDALARLSTPRTETSEG